MKRVMCTICLILISGCTVKQFEDIIGITESNKQYSQMIREEFNAFDAKWAAEDAEDKAYNEEHNIKHRIDRWNDPLALGMTTTKVYEKWGTATKNSESFSASGHLLVWKYGQDWGRFGTYYPPDTYLYFLDNKLIQILKIQ